MTSFQPHSLYVKWNDNHKWLIEKEVEALVSYFQVLSQDLLGVTEEKHKISVTIATHQTQIQTRNLPTTKQKH